MTTASNTCQDILIVEDDKELLTGYKMFLGKKGYHATCAETLGAAMDYVNKQTFNIALLDVNLPDGYGPDIIPGLKSNDPRMSIIVVTSDNKIETAVDAIKRGADNYLVKPFKWQNLEAVLDRSSEFTTLRRRSFANESLQEEKSIVFGDSSIIRTVVHQAEIAAKSDTNIFITGETGTGKGVLARHIHQISNRNEEAFVELNCSTLKGDLLKSELFGHAKGAFTSAYKDRQGLIESADRGTLFLDEIGDMDWEVQTMLLKVLEEHTFRRLGENKLRKSSFRLLCATNKDLHEAVEKKEFREDLLYRINVFPLTLPPLRERTQDIGALTISLLRELNYKHDLLDETVIAYLSEVPLRGNIRELRNTLERAMILAQGTPLQQYHFSSNQGNSNEKKESNICFTLKSAEQEHIKKVIAHFHNDKTQAAQALGISVPSLYRKLEQIRSKQH